MNRIAKFEKVSIGQFTAAWKDTFQERSEEKIRDIKIAAACNSRKCGI